MAASSHGGSAAVSLTVIYGCCPGLGRAHFFSELVTVTVFYSSQTLTLAFLGVWKRSNTVLLPPKRAVCTCTLVVPCKVPSWQHRSKSSTVWITSPKLRWENVTGERYSLCTKQMTSGFWPSPGLLKGQLCHQTQPLTRRETNNKSKL